MSLERDLAALAEMGKDPAGGMTRLALSESDAAARNYVRGRMEELGLEISHDVVGNLYGRRPGTDAGAAPVLTGSHLDTVPRGGRYDGPLGVVGALEALRLIGRTATRRPIDVVVFVGEEGSRFGRGTIGSAAVAGDVPLADIFALKDAAGVSYAEALKTYGDDPAKARALPFARGASHAFVELHIEQGGILEASGVPIGVPLAIAGLLQHVIRLTGDANHAGATPMDLRRDALAAAAELILAVEKAAHEVGHGAVGTVGRAEVEPGGFNIIPGVVTIGTDLRATRPEHLDALDRLVRAAAADIAARRRVPIDVKQRQRVEPGPLDERVVAAVERGAAAAGYRSHRMFSGAIHDALHMANHCPSGMIFVPSKGGKSHCPEEETPISEMLRGCETLARTLVDLAS